MFFSNSSKGARIKNRERESSLGRGLSRLQRNKKERVGNARLNNSSRSSHSNRLCTNTRDRGQEWGQAVKSKNLEGKAVKGTAQIRNSLGSSTVRDQPDAKSHQGMISLTTNGLEVNDVHSILFAEAPTLVASMNYS